MSSCDPSVSARDQNVSKRLASGRPVKGWLTRGRLMLYSGIMLVLLVLFMVAWTGVSHGFTTEAVARPGVDFSVFWAASYLMLHGAPWQAYDHIAFATTEHALFTLYGKGDFLPWLYPPTYLVAVTPLALLPVRVAHLLFVGGSVFVFVSGALRVSGLARSVGGWRTAAFLVAACPCVFVTSVFGQNSLLTAAMAAFAVLWLERHPVRAGLCIGLLAIKPQMAVVFPFVLIAAGAWRVFAVAALSGAAFAAISAWICGIRALQGFFVNLRLGRELILEHSVRFHLASPTTFAALRLDDVPLVPAYLAQGAVAAIAIAAACVVWKRSRDTALRAAVLVTATLLSNPYLWHYELAWLGIALAGLTASGLSGGWRRGEQVVIVLAWLLPLYEFFNPGMLLPQVGPIVLLLVLLVISRRTDAHVRAHIANCGAA